MVLIKRLSSTVLCLLIVLSFLQFGYIIKRTVKIRDFRVSYRQEGGVNVHFHLYRAFRADVREKVEAGAKVTFNYYIRLYKRNTGWIDQKLDEERIQTTVQYDLLTKEYRLSRLVDGNMEDESTTTHEEEMRRWMTTIRAASFSDFRPQAGPIYYVRAKALIQSDFALMLFPWNFETVWRKKLLPSSP